MTDEPNAGEPETNPCKEGNASYWGNRDAPCPYNDEDEPDAADQWREGWAEAALADVLARG